MCSTISRLCSLADVFQALITLGKELKQTGINDIYIVPMILPDSTYENRNVLEYLDYKLPLCLHFQQICT